jgi:hypothetical protein
LTPEEQDRANQVVRDMNSQGLQSQGVEPTESNLQLAHFLGAKGAADYLSSGYISPEAAAANGGLEKTRQIAESRLAMGRGPAVAGVGREMGMGEPGYGGAGTMPVQPSRAPGVDQVIGMQGNIEQLAAYIGNPDNPKEARDAARYLIIQPPLEFPARAAYSLIAAAAVALLPAWSRFPLRLPYLPLTEFAVAQPLGDVITRTFRWAIDGDLDSPTNAS